jgi:hypothetical protein
MELSVYKTLSHQERKNYHKFMTMIETRGRVNTNMSPCWTHSLCKSSSGYGQIMFQTIAYSHHRYSYLVHNGFPDLPSGYDVCHACDNKDCANPEHLSAKPHRDNCLEAVERIRPPQPAKESSVNLEPCYNCVEAHRGCDGAEKCSRCVELKLECVKKPFILSPGAFKVGACVGESNANAKLNWEKVREIRAKISAGLPYGGLKKLAVEYGIQYITAQKIKANETWKLENDPLQK